MEERQEHPYKAYVSHNVWEDDPLNAHQNEKGKHHCHEKNGAVNDTNQKLEERVDNEKAFLSCCKEVI